MSNKIPLNQLFNGLQSQMSAQLNTNREFINHPGSKGDALEEAWIEWLRKYLPNRYSVDKGIVIDHEGNTSHQIDIIIYDNWFTPFIFTQNGFHYIPAEGVYAVFEVKPDLKGNVEEKTYIEYAGDKIESVRKLKRTSTDIINAGDKWKARPLTKIVGGILASTNTIKKTSTIEKHLKSLTGLKSIDFGCAVDYGSFYIDYIGSEDVNKKDVDEFQERFLNYYNDRTFNKIEFSDKENSLVTFFMQLTRYLQQAIGTVAAIDLQKYLDSIGEKLDEEI
ncbi:hypothetical protein SAMN05443634_10386 [Chishuiella changwenlii]|uniref:DUF6602 domain-containing protein n=1 Tax=Chishuiella changwenlii TaxID=1434701 RepID=A0A1M6UVX0_9FLAO|nr:DUF6602 domain-containing protein [Chishuiella changwenlii]GGF07789.1 hypothetical protein GCM10010984_26220 [Chishuiella changwenlii]SHK73382.1 hypothetical protein SAMN05443634_10386 [Chishuiella changwenlii]